MLVCKNSLVQNLCNRKLFLQILFTVFLVDEIYFKNATTSATDNVTWQDNNVINSDEKWANNNRDTDDAVWDSSRIRKFVNTGVERLAESATESHSLIRSDKLDELHVNKYPMKEGNGRLSNLSAAESFKHSKASLTSQQYQLPTTPEPPSNSDVVTVFDWKLIDKLTEGKQLPVLKRVKRLLEEENYDHGNKGEDSYAHQDQYQEQQRKKIMNPRIHQTKGKLKIKFPSRVSDRTSLEFNSRTFDHFPKGPALKPLFQVEKEKRLANYSSSYNNIYFLALNDTRVNPKSRRFPADLGYPSYNDAKNLGIKIFVSQDGVILHVNNVEVYSHMNNTIPWGKTRNVTLHSGVHVITLCPSTGKVMRNVNLMTWQLSASAQLLREIKGINPGRILIIIGVPEFYKFLTDPTIDKMMDLGSFSLERLVMYESFVLVTLTGGPVIHEAIRTKYIYNNTVEMHGPPMMLDLLLKKNHTDRCNGVTTLKGDHFLFCQLYAGYGEFCACNATLDDYLPRDEIHNNSIPIIAIALVGAQRLPQVLQQIFAVRSNAAGQRVPLLMCLDGNNQQAEHFARLLNVTVAINIANRFKKGTAARVNHMVQWSIEKVFDEFQDVEFAIILEDDLKLAPDFMPFFRQTTSLLANPKELLFCVNAYNYNSFPETATNYSRLYRHQGTPAYGWMITRAVGKELQEYDLWPLEYNPSDWDFYLQTTMLNSRHILAPEMPRTQHVGGGGVHVTGLEQERFFNRRTFNDHVTYVKMDVQSARRNIYLKRVRRAIKHGVQLDLHKTHPCHADLFSGHPDNSSFVIYIDQPDHQDEYRSHQTVMKCLGANDRDVHEQLMKMFHFYTRGHPIYVIGCPGSYYCKYNTAHLTPYRPSHEDQVLADKLFLERVPAREKISYRMNSSISIKSFALEDDYEHTISYL
uniref:Protein O-linked-mannose beta-1,2-N-acetylglucosaminyltransferase 1-like n=1 Tax=Hirondellea gigas TaxID=1518452 RepID=A0A6A7G4M2_9CRUS